MPKGPPARSSDFTPRPQATVPRSTCAELDALVAAGERAYDRLYDARDRQDLNWLAELATDSYRDALRTAENLGLRDEVDALRERLLHIKAVIRQLR